MNKILKNLLCFKKNVNSLRIFDSRSLSLSSSSSSSFTPQRYDVFLSFRGADTRKSFVSFLYRELESKRIRTFKDDKELERGRPISPELLQAIKGSRIAVVVVSVNYPASPWCLEELREILKLQKLGLLTVIPIFYEIDPSAVRRQIGVVLKQFKKHEKRESKEKVKSWREALTKLASLSGECSKDWYKSPKPMNRARTKYNLGSVESFLKISICFSLCLKVAHSFQS
ncbi:PREDICTED: toll/interleukin-1 receptor-like protein [Camelina sativa]|uniref:Toll/interleukin-1 receptor-like protein n=1 Tax=Camelina sativa TaxID=90675 RepID=A0ABM1Q985_CAMSA|nr:PREDICTED: toll/interleukin-1 receptor-like protein [Camelina sativa]